MNRSLDVLLDRDGVLIAERPGYVLHPDDVELLPSAGSAVRRLCQAGCRVFVLTNQSPVGRGLINAEDLRAIHEHLSALLRAEGGRVDGYFVCPHRPEDACACRKPQPGLFYAARDHAGVVLSRAIMVGDQASDVVAARRAGCQGVLISNAARPIASVLATSVPMLRDLRCVADAIVQAVPSGFLRPATRRSRRGQRHPSCSARGVATCDAASPRTNDTIGAIL